MGREAEGREPVRDSVEQLEDEPVNPITEDAKLTEPGKGFQPGTTEDEDEPELDEGPALKQQQMPR